jgi:hypothetical protein
MAVENFDLNKRLQPLAPERFFSEYWEKKHLFLQRRDPDYFQGLMTRQRDARDVEVFVLSFEQNTTRGLHKHAHHNAAADRMATGKRPDTLGSQLTGWPINPP